MVPQVYPGVKIVRPVIIGGTVTGAAVSGESLSTTSIPVSAVMTTTQSNGALIDNFGQTLDNNITLLAPAAGMSFKFVAATTVAKYFRFTPATGGQAYLDGLSSGINKYIQVASVNFLDAIYFEAIKNPSGVYVWSATSILGAWTQQA